MMVMVSLFVALAVLASDVPTVAEASRAMDRAVRFFRTSVSAHGGYLWRYSADLKKREGEGKADPDCVWVQPPGTPAVGMAYLSAYELTKRGYLLDAAREVGECLLQGQLRSGGWAHEIRFEPSARSRYAYRVDPERPRANDRSQLDDDMTQSAIRFLLRLEKAQGRKDRRISEALDYALDALIEAQYPNGAWPQSFTGSNRASSRPVKAASFPETWSRMYTARPYAEHYTLNDNVMGAVIETLLDAWDFRRNARYRDAAVRGGEFLALAQLPEPQPGWAQQYDADMHPAWARKFEPPAITGGESQQVMRTLIMLALRTGERRFLAPIPRALAYYRRLLLPDGRLARFYEIGTDRPLYFTQRYELTYDDSDTPTHYSFKVASHLDAIERAYEAALARLGSGSTDRRASVRATPPTGEEVRVAVNGLDERGAWVEDGRLRYHGDDDDTRRVIACDTFIRRLDVLARYIASKKTAPAARREGN